MSSLGPTVSVTVPCVPQGKEPGIVDSLARYVTDEYDNKLKEKVDTSEWARRLALLVCFCVGMLDTWKPMQRAFAFVLFKQQSAQHHAVFGLS